MNEETKIFIIELLIDITDSFTSLSDKLNILYFKFEPLLKDISEDSNPSNIPFSDRDKIYKEIQTSLHNIHHILYNGPDTFNNFKTLQNFRSRIDMNTENIQKNLNNLTGIYK